MRSSVSIVPQSPDLFEGTVRENIDPIGEHADIDIWTALDQVNISAYQQCCDPNAEHPSPIGSFEVICRRATRGPRFEIEGGRFTTLSGSKAAFMFC